MANVDSPQGFRLVHSTREVIRRERIVDSSNSNALARGDAYIIEADGNITRCTVTNVVPRGIVESFKVAPKSGQGPESQDYLPASTAGVVIGIEDPEAEFEVQCDTCAQSDFTMSKQVDIADTAPDATLRRSKQEVAIADGDQFKVVGLSPRVGNALGTDAKIIVKLISPV